MPDVLPLSTSTSTSVVALQAIVPSASGASVGKLNARAHTRVMTGAVSIEKSPVNRSDDLADHVRCDRERDLAPRRRTFDERFRKVQDLAGGRFWRHRRLVRIDDG